MIEGKFTFEQFPLTTEQIKDLFSRFIDKKDQGLTFGQKLELLFAKLREAGPELDPAYKAQIRILLSTHRGPMYGNGSVKEDDHADESDDKTKQIIKDVREATGKVLKK